MSFSRSRLGIVLTACVLAFPGLRPVTAEGCTIAVVSGRATEDGRPLLWKNRDTESRQNLVQVFADGKYRLVAVIDAGHPETIWMGMNEAGLCLANSLSLDLPRGHKTGRGNGRFMKLALQNCASVADFERLLSETNETGRRTRANFGAIDAYGAAALFEAGHRSFVKFDANDSQIAPRGYIVRSNFSMTATGAQHLDRPEEFLKIYSGRRYLRAEGLIGKYVAQHRKLDYRYFLQTLSRDLSEDVDGPAGPWGLLPVSLGNAPQDAEKSKPAFSLPAVINTQSTINRRSTVSAVVFHGVKPQGSPQWTTMWTLLGQPAFSVAVPCWITTSPTSRLLCGTKRSSLCAAAWKVRELNYESPHLLSTRWLGRIWSQTLKVEDHIIQKTAERLARWRKDAKLQNSEEVAGFEDEMAAAALKSLLAVQKLITPPPASAEKPPRSKFVAEESQSLQAVAPTAVGE